MISYRVVFHSVAPRGLRAIATGVACLLLPSAIALAQTPESGAVPDPRIRPSVSDYSLPPGPRSTPEDAIRQGPVDADSPLAPPPAARPRTPTEPASSAQNPPPAASAPRESETDGPEQTADAPQPLSRPEPPLPATGNPTRPEPAPPAEADPVPSAPASASAIPESRDTVRSDPETPPAPDGGTADGYLLVVALLLFVLLGSLWLWRTRQRASPAALVTDSEAATISPRRTSDRAAEPSVPAITMGFRPRSANATLINAVLGFELTLSNPTTEEFTAIRIHGIMVQARKEESANTEPTDLAPIRDLPGLEPGETETVIAEFRVPLASIHPIMFRSQALFVPQVKIAIEFTDGSGTRHQQSAAYLIGQEHQPPRPKLAPLRLDMGPRSFAPLGHRPLAFA